MTFFEPLRQSGLPLDWTTLWVGWQGIGRFDRHSLLALDELRDYALEQVVSASPEPETAVVDLAFVEEGDFWTIKRCFEQLAPDAPEDIARAKRLWRWVILSETVTHLEREALRLPAPNSLDYGEWLDDFHNHIYFRIREIWEAFDFPIGELSDEWHDDLPAYRTWLTQEHARLQVTRPITG